MGEPSTSGSSGSGSSNSEVIEKLTFLDEVGIQKLSEAILKKTNTRISDRIVQELNDASDANHVVSAALLNTLLKARDTLIGANTTAIATNKTDTDKLVADVGDLTTKVDNNTTNVAAAAAGITALDEKIAGLTHLTIDTVVGPISGVTDPKSDVLYLQKDDEADTTWMLYIYREDNTWAQIGDTGVDLSDYWSKDDNAAIKDAVGVPEVTPLAEDKILAAIDSAFDSTDLFNPGGPTITIPYGTIVLDLDQEGNRVSENNVKLQVGIYPADTPIGQIVWTSSNPEIATVDNEGNVRSVAIGSCAVTATMDGKSTASILVTVVKVHEMIVNGGNIRAYKYNKPNGSFLTPTKFSSTGGPVNVKAPEGCDMTIEAKDTSNKSFDHWKKVSGNVELADYHQATQTIKMPAGGAEFTAVFVDKS